MKGDTILFKDKLMHSSMQFSQDAEGGVIWVKSTGEYPITPNEMKQIIEKYKKE